MKLYNSYIIQYLFCIVAMKNKILAEWRFSPDLLPSLALDLFAFQSVFYFTEHV